MVIPNLKMNTATSFQRGITLVWCHYIWQNRSVASLRHGGDLGGGRTKNAQVGS
jgi:hypothetical protein